MEKINNSILFLGNCLEVMKQIPDKSIDLILCDLPYGETKKLLGYYFTLVPIMDSV